MNKDEKIIAVCGLDCGPCDIRLATTDKKIAQENVDWFKKEMNVDVKIEDIHCDGCRGDRSKHWSPDCWILKCCVDEHGLENCSQCNDFPCEKLIKWASESAKYGEALERLKAMV